MNWLLYIPREGDYHFPANKQTKKNHKQTNEQKIMQYTQNISYLIRIKRPDNVKKIVGKESTLRFRDFYSFPEKTNLFIFFSFSFISLWPWLLFTTLSFFFFFQLWPWPGDYSFWLTSAINQWSAEKFIKASIFLLIS